MWTANPIGCDPCAPRAAPPSRARRRCHRSAPSIGLERSRDRVRSLPSHDRLQGPDRGQRREVEPKLAPTPERVPAVNLATLSAIERRVLWLAVRIVDYANRERPKQDALKVGGHQASSASMVTLMTALYLADLRAEDRVSREAARIACAARARVSPGAPRSVVPDTPAGLRRAAVVPLAREGSLSGRLLDRLGRPRLGCPVVRGTRRQVREDAARRFDGRAIHLAARRCRTGRGQHLGGACASRSRGGSATFSGSST